MYKIEPRDGNGHTTFAVYDGETLVCICVYKKGAVEVVRRLAGQETVDAILEAEKQARREARPRRQPVSRQYQPAGAPHWGNNGNGGNHHEIEAPDAWGQL